MHETPKAVTSIPPWHWLVGLYFDLIDPDFPGHVIAPNITPAAVSLSPTSSTKIGGANLIPIKPRRCVVGCGAPLLPAYLAARPGKG
jgi:hypothetical protein